MPDAEKDPTMTLAEVEALVEDDVMTWLENPFMSPEMLAGKVCWWVTVAVHAARDTSVIPPAETREARP